MKNRVLLLLLPALLSLPHPSGAGVGHAEKHPVGVPAPMFVLTSIDGASYDLGQHLGKKPILIVFWSLFCATCREDIPTLQAVAVEAGGGKLELVGVNIDGRIPDAIREEMKKSRYVFTSLMDEMSYGELAAADPYGVDSTPVTFLIDRRGWINAVWTEKPDPAVIRAAILKVME